MKKLLLLIIFLLIPVLAQAKVYLIVNTDTDEIVSMSNEDDAVLPEGNFKKEVIDEDFKKIKLTDNPTDYKFKNGQFIKNIDKISQRAIKNQKENSKKDEIRLIENKALYTACQTLDAEGVNFKEVNCEDFN